MRLMSFYVLLIFNQNILILLQIFFLNIGTHIYIYFFGGVGGSQTFSLAFQNTVILRHTAWVKGMQGPDLLLCMCPWKTDLTFLDLPVLTEVLIKADYHFKLFQQQNLWISRLPSNSSYVVGRKMTPLKWPLGLDRMGGHLGQSKGSWGTRTCEEGWAQKKQGSWRGLGKEGANREDILMFEHSNVSQFE